MRFADVVVAAVARTGAEVVPARAQMATTLGFHIILACLSQAVIEKKTAASTAIDKVWQTVAADVRRRRFSRKCAALCSASSRRRLLCHSPWEALPSNARSQTRAERAHRGLPQ